MKDDVYNLMVDAVKVLQNNSSFSTKKIAELFMLDLEYNKGRILSEVETLAEEVQLFKKGKKK